jgi:phosphopantothenate-cysteine ligase
MDLDAFFQQEHAPLSHLEQLRHNLSQFVCAQPSDRKVALVTSGGTIVPLEHNTVRFLDNFSTGSRGAACAEGLLKRGYGVVFMHRTGSLEPWGMVGRGVLDHAEVGEKGVWVQGEDVVHAVRVRQLVVREKRMLKVEFRTVQEYLFMLREAVVGLSELGSRAMVFLAAAVSDFYIPEERMIKHKIQSSAEAGLTIVLDNVPKALGWVKKVWAPKCFLVTFKLETDAQILHEKVVQSFEKYGQDAIVANLLQTRFAEVNLYSKGSHSPRVITAKEDINEGIVDSVIHLHDSIL